MSTSPSSSRWLLTAFLFWSFGLVHVFPFLGVYMLMFNKQYAPAMLVGFALTGLGLGLVQALTRGPRALLFTPASFLAGWAPLPLLMAANVPFSTVSALTLLTSVGCICLGQWALNAERGPQSPSGA
ncbi:hypothetical protein [Corallococcus carmarthensis]|uniref:hypothetical protein n=1 Tax=Corallococcus carmarthensis TaxID=2316728 RepID=UPI00148C118E|nr:hypothetical protein [Corallococcus carmarthensis]NOK17320.1 hypothetical protein [Corallococcus carmarthensis]